MLELTARHLGGVLEFGTSVFTDDRGRFLELGRNDELASFGVPELVQVNASESTRGVLRGIHYQLPPRPQGKLVSVLAGSIWDVGVDLRRSSETFLQWVGVELSSEAANLLYLPEGFGHAFVVTSPRAIVLYRATNEYDPVADRSLAWDDPAIGIEWPRLPLEFRLSDKDRAAPTIESAQLFP
jgi:dTDP-4-dehydrorhamnose 3,5-epimerase